MMKNIQKSHAALTMEDAMMLEGYMKGEKILLNCTWKHKPCLTDGQKT